MRELMLDVAKGARLDWARKMVAAKHYLRSAPDHRSRPLAYVVRLGAEPIGCLWFGRTEATRCFQGGLTYGDLGDVQQGRATWDRWEVLNLSRFWLSPAVQPGGELHSAEHLPGFRDRKGVWRSTLASSVIQQALARVGFDYLKEFPPVFVEMPFVVRVVSSYCDTRRHRGVIYRATGFRLARTNSDGIETWWTSAVAGLTSEQDRAVRELAAWHPRSVRIRNRSRSLFDMIGG